MMGEGAAHFGALALENETKVSASLSRLSLSLRPPLPVVGEEIMLTSK